MKARTYLEWETDKGRTLLRQVNSLEWFVAVATCNADELRELASAIAAALGELQEVVFGTEEDEP